MTRLAILADIHGNLPALEAVMADLAGRRVEGVVNLGDCVSGPLWPAETLALLRQHEWSTVRGNHDRQVGGTDETALGQSDHYAFTRLTPADRDWLFALPPVLDVGSGILAMHACPDNDNAYLLERQVGGRLQRADPAEVAARIGRRPGTMILTAHSHLAATLRLPDGRWILNPGSVGCPAYDDDSTDPAHISEAGSPAARYAIIETTRQDPMIELFSVPYPTETAARQADAAGRPDWAHALRTGFSLWRPA